MERDAAKCPAAGTDRISSRVRARAILSRSKGPGEGGMRRLYPVFDAPMTLSRMRGNVGQEAPTGAADFVGDRQPRGGLARA